MRFDPGAASGVSTDCCELEQSSSGGILKFLGDARVRELILKLEMDDFTEVCWKWGAVRDTLGNMRYEDQHHLS